MSDYFVCPICGTDVSIKATACPECGSDEETGWSENTMYDGIDIPDINESNVQTSGSILHNKLFLSIVAVLTILAIIWLYLI